ncbi:unnamed protein product [Ostreobium quekettii]|uniref:Sulfotransferase family protein n=1 Tax=Ostreobium quekettii TaxID=121088 RepID=A0A8S1IMS0_9CHLO|nr:unnamed protein product [Ostreobium quekettii]
MLSARCRNRGPQKKTGMVDPKYWMAEHFEYRKSQMWSWIDKPGATHPPTPFPHCQVYINHDYRFIWVKGYKVGGTAMRGSLGWLCDDSWWVPQDADLSHCSTPLWKNSSLTAQQAQEWWREYFVFGVVRNPLARFSSGYEYISQRMPENCTVPGMPAACRDPYVFAKTCRATACCNNSTVDHHVRHFGDQARCLFSQSDAPAVDFIAETENLDDDLEAIVNIINERRPEIMPPLVVTSSYGNPGPGAQSKKPGERARERVSALREDPDCVPELVRMYRNDYVTLGYGDT